MFGLNDKVRVIKKNHPFKEYEDTFNKEGVVEYIDYRNYKYGVALTGISNPKSKYGRFYFTENEIELIDNNNYPCDTSVPSFEDISYYKIDCIIIVTRIAEACIVDNNLDSKLPARIEEYFEEFNNFSCNVDNCLAIRITSGKISGFGTKRSLESCNSNIYTCLDITKASCTGVMGCRTITTNDKESIKMKNTFMVENSTRTRFAGESTKEKSIETITTTVSTFLGTASTTCDKVWYDAYMGALVAAAKITANKSEEAMLIYKTAIDVWGTGLCVSILKSLANRAFGATPFDRAYKKWRKAVAYEEKIKSEKERTCSVCGKMFESVEEARAHEKWHKECKRNRAERKEAKRRIAEAEREGRIEDIMRELIDNKESTND